MFRRRFVGNIPGIERVYYKPRKPSRPAMIGGFFDFLKNKYGIENSAKVATYSRFHPKGILRDIARIFSIPISEVEKVCSLVIERSGGDARASFGLLDTFSQFAEAKLFKSKYPEATELAIKLEGHIRHKGVHAAALVITDKLMHEYAPVGKLGGEIVIE